MTPTLTLAEARESMLDSRIEGPAALGALRDRVAREPRLMEIARYVPPHHHAQGNLQSLFFHGVLYLAAKHRAGDVLARVASLVATDALDEATFHLLRDFAVAHDEELRAALQRGKQTNNVTRSAALLPAFCLAAAWADAPLGLVELGPSVGINLCWDHFAYDLGDLGRFGRAASPCQIPFRIVNGTGGATAWLPDLTLPPVATRVGLELAPVDLDASDELAWLRCWSAGVDPAAIARFDAAIEVVRGVRPRIVPGDAVANLVAAVDAIPREVVACTFSSFMAYQLEPSARRELASTLARIGRTRRLVHVSLGDAPAPRGARLDITYFDVRGAERTILGYCDAVGDAGTTLTWLGGAAPGDG